MITYKRYKYDVYRDGKLFMQNARPIEISDTIGCEQAVINTYARKCSTHHNKDGHKYTFEIAETKIFNKPVKVIDNSEVFTQMDQEWIDEWNNMRTAAKLLKTGHGKIINKLINGEYQKVTVMA